MFLRGKLLETFTLGYFPPTQITEPRHVRGFSFLELAPMRLNLTTVVVAAGCCLLLAGLVNAAVTTTTHTSYALRPCSICREVAYPTESECRAAAQAEAQRVGLTRTTGGAVYTCITRHNVIATFSPGPVTGTAPLSWTPPTQNIDGTTLTNLAGYRISYGTSPTALTSTIQVTGPSVSTFAVTGLAPGAYYFSIRAYTSNGTESANSNIVTKSVQ